MNRFEELDYERDILQNLKADLENILNKFKAEQPNLKEYDYSEFIEQFDELVEYASDNVSEIEKDIDNLEDDDNEDDEDMNPPDTLENLGMSEKDFI